MRETDMVPPDLISAVRIAIAINQASDFFRSPSPKEVR